MNTLSLDLKSSRRATAMVVLAGACVLSLAGRSPWIAGATAPVGAAFPEFGRYGLEGTVPDLKGKVVLVDFWASWCAPCKQSFSVMKEVHEKFAQRGFVVVTISLDEKKADMEAFLKRNPTPLLVLHDPKGRLAEATGIEQMPTSFVLGPDGKVVAVHRGFEGKATRKAYFAEIEALLKAS